MYAIRSYYEFSLTVNLWHYNCICTKVTQSPLMKSKGNSIFRTLTYKEIIKLRARRAFLVSHTKETWIDSFFGKKDHLWKWNGHINPSLPMLYLYNARQNMEERGGNRMSFSPAFLGRIHRLCTGRITSYNVCYTKLLRWANINRDDQGWGWR